MRCARRSSGARDAVWLALRRTLIALVTLLTPLHDAHPHHDSVLATWNELEIEIAELQARTTAPTLDELEQVSALLDRLAHDDPAIQTWTPTHVESFANAAAELAGAQLDAGSSSEVRRRNLARARAIAAGFGVDRSRSRPYIRCVPILALYAGELASSEGLFAEAIAAFRRSIDDSNRTGDPLSLPRSYTGMAEALRLIGRYGDAEIQLEALERLPDLVIGAAAEPMAPETSTWLADARSRLRSSRILLYADMGMPDQAARWLARRDEEAGPPGPDDEAIELDLAAVVALAGERCRRVVDTIDDDVLARTSQSRIGVLLARRGVALTELALRHPELVDAARADLDEALALAPSFSMRRLAEITLLDLAAIRGDWTDMARRIERLRGRVDDPALNVDERATLAAHAARLARETNAPDADRDVALAELRAAYAAQLEAWRSPSLRTGGVGFLNYSGRRSALGELVGELVSRAPPAKLGEVELEPVFRGEAVGTLARALNAPTATLAAIRAEVLHDDVGWIAFVPAARTTHVFAVDRDQVVHCEIAWRYLSEPLQNDLGAEVARVLPRGDQAAVDAQRVLVGKQSAEWAGHLLPKPIQSALRRWSGCYVTGLELLGNPPFEVLPIDGRPLGIARAVARLPSMAVALALARRPRRPLDATVPALRLFAAPVLEPATRERAGDPPSIVLDDASVHALTEPFGAGAVETFLGEDATLAALRTSARRPPRVLHILAHAIERLDREDFTTLVLAGDDEGPGLLSPSEADTWLACDVLVLSACAAAQGRTRIGDDGAGQFVGAGFRAGARCVLAADQRIELEATVEFGRLVHRALADGACPAEAGRRARERMDASAAFKLPSCWALIAVHGLGFER